MYFLLRIRNNDTTGIIVDEYEQNAPGGGIFIELYPFDNVPTGIKRKVQLAKSSMLFLALNNWNRKENFSGIKRLIISGLKMFPIESVWRMYEKNNTKYSGTKTEYVDTVALPSYAKQGIHFYKKTDVQQTVSHSYEFIDLNIPKGNDTCLRQQYGDYMELPPLEKRGSAFKTNATGKAKIKHYVSNAIYKIAGPKNIDKKRNDIFRKVSIESSNEIGLVSFLFNNNRRNYWKKEWVLNCTNAPFEFLNVTVPIAADEVLTKTYGNWRMFEKGMAMHSGIDFDVSKSYMEVLRDKYHYEEFKSYNSQKGKKLDYETERGGVLRPIAPNENQTIYDMLQGIDKQQCNRLISWVRETACSLIVGKHIAIQLRTISGRSNGAISMHHPFRLCMKNTRSVEVCLCSTRRILNRSLHY